MIEFRTHLIDATGSVWDMDLILEPDSAIRLFSLSGLIFQTLIIPLYVPAAMTLGREG